MISYGALEWLRETAQNVGFGPRPDYPYLTASAVSAADWKGESIAIIPFSLKELAHTFVELALGTLDSLGGGPKGEVLKVETPNGRSMYIAVITATDLVHKDELVDWDGPVLEQDELDGEVTKIFREKPHQ